MNGSQSTAGDGRRSITLHLEKCTAPADILGLPVTLFTVAESRRIGSQCTDTILCEVRTLLAGTRVLSNSTRIHLSLFLIYKTSLNTSADPAREKRLPETWCNSCKGETHAESRSTKQYRGADSWAVSHMTGYSHKQAAPRSPWSVVLWGRRQESPMLSKYADSNKFLEPQEKLFCFRCNNLLPHNTHPSGSLSAQKQRDLWDCWKERAPQSYILKSSKISDNFISSITFSPGYRIILSKFQRLETWLSG